MIDGAQDLRCVDGFPFAVRASVGAEPRAEQIAERVQRALGWLSEVLGPGPGAVHLLVLDPADWEKVASIPIYAAPTFRDTEAGPTIVTGSEPAPFWNEVLELMRPDVSPETRGQVLAVYGDPPDPGRAYSDLVVVHGLTHLFHEPDADTGEGDFPRLWLAELFADLGLTGYLADVEPEQLPVLQTACLMTREVAPSRLPVRSLDDMGTALSIDPHYYCVYQHLLTLEAARIWDAAGVRGLRSFHTELRRPEMTDEEILTVLERLHPPTAVSIRDWLAGRLGATAVPG